MTTAERAKVLLELAERVEREEPGRELWRDAFELTNPEPAPPIIDGQFTAYWTAWSGLSTRFNWLLGVGAYLDAADMLRPVDMEYQSTCGPSGVRTVILYRRQGPGKLYTDAAEGMADGPHAEARARLAASLRAVAAGGG